MTGAGIAFLFSTFVLPKFKVFFKSFKRETASPHQGYLKLCVGVSHPLGSLHCFLGSAAVGMGAVYIR